MNIHIKIFFIYRYANFGNATVGHFTNAGKCFAFVFLCVLYFWHRWRSAVGRNSKAKMCLTVT